MRKRYILVLFITIVIAFFLPLGIAPLFDLDEGAFSEATREMLVSGDYITTYLNGNLRFDKPILIYWLQAISVKVFGLNEFALRLPSALASLVWAFSIFWFTEKFLGLKRAFFASFFMVTALQINIITKAAIADALLNMFIAISMFALYIYYSTKEKKYLYLAFLSIALGTLTKGPVAVMIPLVVTLIFYIINGKFTDWLKMIFDPVGVLIFLVVALPWYIAEYIAQGDAFIEGFFLKHNISRFKSPMEKHGGSIFYFIPVLLIGLLPFTHFVFKIFRDIKRVIRDELKLFLIIWFSFVFIFFSLSGTKLPHYIIYGYTPLFILSSLYIDRFNKNWIFYPTSILLVLLLFLPDIAHLLKGIIRDKLAVVLIENSYESFDIFYRVSILILIGVLIYIKNRKESIFLVGVGAIMIFLVNFIAIPTYGELMQQPIKEAGLLAKSRGYKNIVMYKVNTPSFNVYYEGLVLKRKPESRDIVFTKVTKLKDFKNYKIFYRKNGFALIKIK
jgi:4-amino-4-deoxy-L-arabinose transferase-like glycosyltransferase